MITHIHRDVDNKENHISRALFGKRKRKYCTLIISNINTTNKKPKKRGKLNIIKVGLKRTTETV
jgi:hypothetical protein